MKKSLLIISFILLLTNQVIAQAVITGQVKSNTGEPIPGVTVLVKGTTTHGTLTDIDGYYKIPNVPADAILVFSFVGMIKQEIPVGQQAEINVTMEEEITSLDDVVVVGYGQTKRANLTGSVVSIKSEEIKDFSVANLTTALQGKLTGVKVDLSTGRPGSVPDFTIRTSSSFGGITEAPLFVIDGVIRNQEAFDVLDPREVESISILKDAAAAVYGARAAGGVVLVKTKSGKKGNVKITYSGSYGIGQATKMPPMLSAYEHAKMLNDINDLKKAYMPIVPSDYFTDDELEHFKTHQYNWLDDMWKNDYQNRHNLTVGGGTDNVRYFLSGALFNETGNIEQANVSKYSLRSNIEADLSNSLTARFEISADQKKGEQPYYVNDESYDDLRTFFKQSLVAPRWVPPMINGRPVFNSRFVDWNPYGLLQSNNYKWGQSNNSSIVGAFNYKAPFIKGLSASVQYSYTTGSTRGKNFTQDYFGYGYKATGTNRHIVLHEWDSTSTLLSNDEKLYQSAQNSKNYQLNATISFSRQFGKHDINAKLVYEQTESSDDQFSSTQLGAIIDGYDYIWAFPNTGSDKITLGTQNHESGDLGYIGLLNYLFDNKYILEATFRQEASTKFAPDHRWGFFPAASLGWIVSNEDFLKDRMSVLSFLKLRGSAGLVGNDGTPGGYQWLYSYNVNDIDGALFGTSATRGIEISNNGLMTPGLTWQKTRSYNVGVDMRFFKNVLSLSTEYYYRFTYDIFEKRSPEIPTTLGLASTKFPYENHGEMYAKGLEIELGYNKDVFKDFNVSLKTNFTWDKHMKLKVFQNPVVIGRWDDQLLNAPSNQPGHISLGIIRTQAQLDAIFAQDSGYTINGVRPELGMLNYKDISGENYDGIPDGKIDEWDKTIIAKYTSPPFHYGLSCAFSYKNFKLDLTFTGEFGHKVFIEKDEMNTKTKTSSGSINTYEVATAKHNQLAFWKDYWTPQNPDAAFPRPFLYGFDGQISTFWMRDGHTLRLNNLNFSYDLPAKAITKLKFSQLRIYVNITNLWTIISPFDYKDPSVSKAFDYPMIRAYNLGLNFTL